MILDLLLRDDYSRSLVRNSGSILPVRYVLLLFIIWPVRPRARFHCKTIEKIPV